MVYHAQPSVHPCGRREHAFKNKYKSGVNGSSLRAQGTQTSTAFDLPATRFIPAGAGNTYLARCIRRTRTVHPCGRREHLAMKYHGNCQPGSSPRAQGTQTSTAFDLPATRFIPAGAGNTKGEWAGKNITPVHPCGRREHQYAFYLIKT